LEGVAATAAAKATGAGSAAVGVQAPRVPVAVTLATSTVLRGAFVLSAPPATYTKLLVGVPGSVAAATAWPLRPTGNAVVVVQLIVDGLNATFWVTVKVRGVLVPPTVFTTRLPVAAPEGTDVTIRVFVQSLALAMTAATVPPLPLANSTCPVPCVAPRLEP